MGEPMGEPTGKPHQYDSKIFYFRSAFLPFQLSVSEMLLGAQINAQQKRSHSYHSYLIKTV